MQLSFRPRCRPRASLLLTAALLLCSYGEAKAQFLIKWMAIGDMHMYYTQAGMPHSEDYRGHNLHWPGIRNEHGNVRGYATWIGATSFVDETGKTWNYKVAHVGPRVTGVGEVFPLEFTMTSQFEPPVTRVDGLESFQRPIAQNDRGADPNLPAERVIDSRVNTILGIEVERRVLAWSHEDHDDYHITEYTFTNTGNVDDDEEVELPDQTLEGVYFFFQNRYATNRSAGWVQGDAQGWGKWQMNDAVGDGHEDYDVDFRAQYSWLGHTGQTRGRTDIGNYETTVGGPVWNGHDWLLPRADSLGRMGANHFVGKIYLHADEEAYDASVPRAQRVNAAAIDYPDDNTMQPKVWRMQWTGHETTHVNDHLNEAGNQIEYRFMSGEDLLTDPANVGGTKREYPHHADRVIAPLVSDGSPNTFSTADFAHHRADPTLGQGEDGFAFTEAFGPYTLGPGQSVQLVIAEAVAGLSWEAEFEIGRKYMLQAKGSDSTPIEFDANGDGMIDPDTERLTKNLWIYTSRDSLFEVFRRAKANFEAGYNVPSPPLPPREFDVMSEPNQITISWQPYGAPPQAWELWRAQGRYDGLAIDSGDPADKVYETNRHVYKLVARLDGSQTSYADQEVTRGLSYYYYLQAVDDVGGRELKSSRYYAQTYQPAQLKRPPGTALADARIVPNPFHLGASSNLHFSGAKNTLAFLDIPGRATIRIYSEIGELVKTIVHEDLSGDVFWDLQTESQQLVVSGLYVAAITDNETGETVLKKFVIIR